MHRACVAFETLWEQVMPVRQLPAGEPVWGECKQLPIPIRGDEERCRREFGKALEVRRAVRFVYRAVPSTVFLIANKTLH